MDLRTESADYRLELLSPESQHVPGVGGGGDDNQAWRLSASDFQVPERPKNPPFVARVFLGTYSKRRKIAKYYKKQEDLVKGFNEMEGVSESGCLSNVPTEDELKKLAKSERRAIHISNLANLVLLGAKVYASIESKSLAVIASTLDSLLDLLSGFILWFTSYAMKRPNYPHSYPIGKKRMQPVVSCRP